MANRRQNKLSRVLRSCGISHFAAGRRLTRMLTVVLLLACGSATLLAQLDPLLFIKRVPPTIIIVMDTSLRMLEDGNGNFYDPTFYRVSDDAAVMGAFPNIDTVTTKTYRRTYSNLQYAPSPAKYSADSITAIAAAWDPASPLTSNAAGDVAYLDPTRYNIAKKGIAAAVGENAGSAYRWGLIRLRQKTPAWRVSPDCDFPLTVGSAAQAAYGDSSPCNAGGTGQFAVYVPSVTAASFAQTTAPAGTVMVTPAGNTASTIVTIANRNPWDNAAFVPAGSGGVGYDDRPLTYALDDAKGAAIAAMTADTSVNRTCRNTVVVLITSGKDSGDSSYLASHNVATTASSFLSVTASGVSKRVPIVVLGVKPSAADQPQLQTIATNSGGFYRNVTTVSEVTAAINRAVQFGFVRSTDFDAGKSSEFVPVSPVIGTVNLEGASDATGGTLSNTDIDAVPGGQHLPQRSNFMVTAGFSLPGFDGAVRAFRTYKPETDSTKPIGWTFSKDGTRLWPDLDGRPALAGMARTVADPATRNIYTYLPDGSGGGSVVAFSTANAAALTTALGVSDAAAFIESVRAQPLGAVIGSTPALMDAPSLDPPPDTDYGFPDSVGTFAGDHKDRRSILFFGANDGMIHAIDARTGYEVWAFIPYNLLPKLKTLRDGQPVEQFDFFVDSSPKIAEVKLNGSSCTGFGVTSPCWRSLLIMGEGPGGTFYQTFDVTEAGMGVSQTADGLSAVSAMLAKFDSPNESIAFKWAFPNYSSFDPAYSATFTVADGTSGGKVKLYGDLKSTAEYAEKTVGFTWSDPAVGPLDSTRTTNAVIVGSGYFPDIETLIPARASGPKAGNALYLLDADTGKPIGNTSGATCTTIASGSGSGSGCINIGDVSNGRKNALQADPTAAGTNGSFVVNRAYLGDTDGKYWRFTLTSTGSVSALTMTDTGQPIYASSALLFVGSTDVYTFFATGSDLLPVTAPGGTGTFKLYGLKDNYPSAATVQFSRNLSAVTNVSGLANGERASAAPSVAGDIVFYTTTVETANTPCADFSANLYAVTYTGTAAYDSDGNAKLDKSESPVAATMAGRATAPFIVDQHLYFGTTGAGGANLESFGDPADFNNGIGQVGVRILSWREIR
jgi:hypothetical protein